MKNAGMKNSGEVMEKVLAGLRDAEAPAGMERRILDGLAERAAARSRSGWRQLLPMWLVAPARPAAVGSLVCGVALAGLFAVALAIPAVRRLGHSLASTRRNPAPAVSRAFGASEAAATNARPASPRSGQRSLEEMEGKIKVEGKTSVGNSEAAVLDSDAVALDDLHAPSRPAPPMPLTEQEKLLLRLVHKDDPVELAMLDPRVRALEDSEDKAEFQRFFGQSTKQPASEQSMTEQAAPQQSTTEPATEQGAPAQPGTEGSTPEQAVPEQGVPEQAMPEQPTQQPSTPEKFDTDHLTTKQTTTQETTPRPTRTGENE
jgi:hypothetical protein